MVSMMKTKMKNDGAAARAVALLYKLENVGSGGLLGVKQMLADRAFAGGRRDIMVLCYANGETNGR